MNRMTDSEPYSKVLRVLNCFFCNRPNGILIAESMDEICVEEKAVVQETYAPCAKCTEIWMEGVAVIAYSDSPSYRNQPPFSVGESKFGLKYPLKNVCVLEKEFGYELMGLPEHDNKSLRCVFLGVKEFKVLRKMALELNAILYEI